MRKLERHEERAIIGEILQKESLALQSTYLGHGSSRVVFDYGKDKVVKIALDNGGITQNLNEINFVENFGDEHVASIYAYSENMIIAEKLDIFDNDYIEEIYNGYFDFEEDEITLDDGIVLSGDEMVDIIDTVNFIEDVIGYSADNFQLGQSNSGKFKSYDYGFLVNESCGEQIGSVSSVIDSGKLVIELDMLFYNLGG